MADAGSGGQLDEAELLRLGIGARRRDEVRPRDAVERRFKRARIVEVPGDKRRREVLPCSGVRLADHRADVGGPLLQLMQQCRACVSRGARDENQIAH
jgi:hypothetical protein